MIKRILLIICVVSLVFPVISSGQTKTQSLIIPEGTNIQISLQDPVSSKLSEPGDEVIATIRKDVMADGMTLLRAGTEIYGKVTIAQSAKRPFKGGQLHIKFDKVRVDGQIYKITTVIQSASDFTRDEKVKSDGEGTLKGGTSGGKVVQNVMTGAGIGGIGATIAILAGAQGNGGGFGGIGISRGGAVAGASILGAGAIAGLMLTKGSEVRLDEKTVIRLKLDRPLSID
ncbi:MAG: hypothetical protein IPL01_16135 [Acidobacteria bacterium]|nr:hypothetical protein [Acidobacteriota bacterium]